MTTDQPSSSSPDPAGNMRNLLSQGRFPEVLAEFRQLQGRNLPPDALLLAATAATRLGDFGLGTSSATAALDRFRSRADDDGRMRSLNLLGVISFERGQLDQAEQCFTQSLELARKLDDNLMMARASNNLASFMYLRNDTMGALTLFRSALLSYQRMGDRRGMAESYHNLGIIFREMEAWVDAMDASERALRHAEQVGEPGLLGLAATGRAEISVARGELDMAQPELLRAAQLARAAGDSLGIIEVGRVQALWYLGRNEYLKAGDEAEKARAAAEQDRAAVLQAECAAVAARAWKLLGIPEKAETRRQEAAQLFQAQGAKRRLEEFERLWQILR
ncbi:MAG: tetratricopeptide repeat protein [Gemmatimonadota bacterium]